MGKEEDDMAEKLALQTKTIQALVISGALGVGALGGGATASSFSGGQIAISEDGTPSPSLQLYVESATVSKEEFEQLKILQEQDHRMIRKMCLQILDNPSDCDI